MYAAPPQDNNQMEAEDEFQFENLYQFLEQDEGIQGQKVMNGVN